MEFDVKEGTSKTRKEVLYFTRLMDLRVDVEHFEPYLSFVSNQQPKSLVFFIMGQSGSGKSTTLKAKDGLLHFLLKMLDWG